MEIINLVLSGGSLGVAAYMLYIISRYRGDTDEAFKALLKERERAHNAEISRGAAEANSRELQYALVEAHKNLKKADEARLLLLLDIEVLNAFLVKFAKGDATGGDLINHWLQKLSKGNPPPAPGSNG